MNLHIAATIVPLKAGDDGMFHVVLPDIPEHLSFHLGEMTIDAETGGPAVWVFFTEELTAIPDDKPRPALGLVQDD